MNDNNNRLPTRIVLIGLSGSGKTTIARLLARLLDGTWRHADTDDMVVALDGRRIPQIFKQSGEEAFRRIEHRAVAQFERGEHTVIATGGGTILDPENRRTLWQDAFVVYLKARPEILAQRVADSVGPPATSRPMLEGGTPAERLGELAALRGPLYELADWIIPTDNLTPEELAAAILSVYERLGVRLTTRAGRSAAWQRPQSADGGVATWVRTPSGSYPVFTDAGELGRLGERMLQVNLKGRATVIADANVAGLYGETVLTSLRAAGFDTELTTIPMGEQHKHLGTVAGVYDFLIGRKSERGDAIVALGGGVTTDLAGLVAATYLRGVPLVHVPTSLLAMVDAAIGGKVAVDHQRGKNLIGAFYQPRLVVADVETLGSLSQRDVTAGWAEVIKHGLILDPDLVEMLERDADRVLALDPEAVTPILRRSAQIKGKIVGEDEREGGLRMTLNYGHTIGHAIEAATGYSHVLHGEAVAVGMQGAASIAVRMGVLAAEVAEQQTRLLGRYNLPLSWPGVDVEATFEAMTLDKKVAARKQRWVLLSEVGRTVIRDDVPLDLVRDVVNALLAP